MSCRRMHGAGNDFVKNVEIVVGCRASAWGREYLDGYRGGSSFTDGRQLGKNEQSGKSIFCCLTVLVTSLPSWVRRLYYTSVRRLWLRRLPQAIHVSAQKHLLIRERVNFSCTPPKEIMPSFTLFILQRESDHMSYHGASIGPARL